MEYLGILVENQPPEIAAAVDLGSNSFHMIVSQLRNGQPHTVDRLREMIQLATGLEASGTLSKQVQNRALECLERFGERLREIPSGTVRAVGTNTFRKARNASQFLSRAEKALGHPIHIISGIEEARLIYLGVAHSLSSASSESRLVVDIGGGSTEFIIGTGTTPITKESLEMGCVSMSASYFADGKINNKRFKRAVLAALRELEPYQRAFQSLGWQEAVGASGTLRSINKVLNAAGWSKSGITFEGLKRLIDAMLEFGHIDKLELPDLDPDRKSVFPGGLAITYATFKALEIEQMRISDGALREGLIYDLVGRIFHEDMRSNSVKLLADRYHVDLKHAHRVNTTAQFCLAQHSFPKPIAKTVASQWLEWATQLHEIGHGIAHSQYHKHGAYILENADLPGFGQQEQKLLALLVRAHRRKFPIGLFDELSPPWNQVAVVLAMILRLSVLLNRSRNPDALPDFKVEISNQSEKIKFPADWLDEHPLTQADLEQEAILLGAIDIKFDFSAKFK